METLKNIQGVSAFFFYVLGFTLFGLAFLVHNHFYGQVPLILLKSLDLPFVSVALLYGITSLRLSLGKDSVSDVTNAVLIFAGVFAFLILVYLNFAFPDYI